MATPIPNKWNPNTTTVYSSSGSGKEIPIGDYDKFIGSGWGATAPVSGEKTTTPPATTTPPEVKPVPKPASTEIVAPTKGVVQMTSQPTLIQITSQRPDVLAEAQKQGGDPYTAGTTANTWLNDWYNRVGKAEGADMASKGMFDDDSAGPANEQEQITVDANKIQEDLFANLPEGGGDIDIRDSQKILDEIKDKMESGEGAPVAPPSMAELFASEKAKLGMEPLETELAGIDSEIEAINAELLIQGEEQGEKLVSMREIGREKGKLQKEADNRIARLNIQRSSVARMLDNKINTLNMVMQFSQQDFANSTAYYKAEFDRSVQMYNLVSGAEDREIEIEEKAEQDAKANWGVIYNGIQDGNIDMANITDEQKRQISELEMQAGLPVGFMDFVAAKNPGFKVQTVTSRTDSSGGEYYDVLKIGPDGEMTVDSIYKGQDKDSTSGGGVNGGYEITSDSGEKLDLTTVGGIETAISNGKNPAEIRKELDSNTKLTVNSINDLIGAGTYNFILSSLQNSIGDDEYVNTGLYKELKQKYPNEFKPFETDEAINQLLNPNDDTAKLIIEKTLTKEQKDKIEMDKKREEFMEEEDQDKRTFWQWLIPGGK